MKLAKNNNGLKDTAMEYLDSLYNFALVITSDTKQAEDLVYDTYMRAFSKNTNSKKSNNFKAWMIKIMWDQYNNKYRSEFTDLTVHSNHKNNPLKNKNMSNEHIYSHQKPFDDPFTSALADLNDELKLMILLTDIEGFEYRETANILDKPVSSIMAGLSQARGTLREILIENGQINS